MKSLLLSLLAMLVVLVFVGCGGKVEKKPQYNYISPEETAKLIRQSPDKLVLIDIQEKDDFDEEHLKGAIATYAYPVKTEEEKARIEKHVSEIRPDQKVVVVCPRGGGGAERAYDFLAQSGIKKDQLVILTDGQYGWPRDTITDVLAQ
jgi:thiosulfate/3-mercaptopyruvate sulfurtransferase